MIEPRPPASKKQQSQRNKERKNEFPDENRRKICLCSPKHQVRKKNPLLVKCLFDLVSFLGSEVIGQKIYSVTNSLDETETFRLSMRNSTSNQPPQSKSTKKVFSMDKQSSG